MRKYWKIILLVPILFYIIFFVTMYKIQEQYMFHPSHTWRPPPVDMNIEEVYIETEENIKLHAWFIKNKDSKYTAIFFHGNAGNITERTWQINVFKELGLQVIKFDYRGFGSSNGKINSIEEIYNDSEAVLEYLSTTYDISYENIILWGRSLGGGIASKLASQYPLGGLIIESSYSRIESLIPDKFMFNIFPHKFFFKYIDLNNTKNLKSVYKPILVIHSKEDDLIPYTHAEEILTHAPENSKLITLTGSHHKNQYENYDLYINALKGYINSLGQ